MRKDVWIRAIQDRDSVRLSLSLDPEALDGPTVAFCPWIAYAWAFRSGFCSSATTPPRPNATFGLEKASLPKIALERQASRNAVAYLPLTAVQSAIH